jgi:hypothetical protein
MIQTADQYFHAVATHDQRAINAMIDRIPANINRAGAHYRKLTKKIREDYAQIQPRHRSRYRSTVSTMVVDTLK